MNVEETAHTTEVYKSSESTRRPTTMLPHVVIVGGGFGGLQVAKALAQQPVDITLIDQNNYHLFQPMLYQVATAGLSPSDISSPIRSILHEQNNVEVLMAQVTGIEVNEQRVLMGKQSVPYDYLILATGATSNYFGHPQWQQLAPGLKSLREALDVRTMVLSAFEAAEREEDPEKRRALLTFVLVGGGPTGVELAGAIAELARQTLAHDFRRIEPKMTRIVLVEGEKRLMPSFPPILTRKTTRKLLALGIEVRTGVHVEQVDAMGVDVGGERIETENVIWTAGVKASPAGQWLQTETDHDGRVKVQDNLSFSDHPNIFVIGDTALVIDRGRPLPGLAPVAIQEGDYVAQRIGDMILHKETRPFHYIDRGMLATVGRSFGVVDVGPLRFTGFVAWLFWLVVHILFLIGFRNRLIVFFQYAWAYFTFQRNARIIYPTRDNNMRLP